MNITTVNHWRKGQTLFLFLEWIKDKHPNVDTIQSLRMADPFYIEDADLDRYYDEFLAEMDTLVKANWDDKGHEF